MAEETEKEQKQIEVDVPVMKTGTTQFMTKAAFNNPAPDKLKRIIAALKFSFVSIITMVSGTDLFTGYQSKIISFTLGLAIIILGGIELATGVKSIEEKQ
jgi:formate/nitrite transporter FocA (FNT family)